MDRRFKAAAAAALFPLVVFGFTAILLLVPSGAAFETRRTVLISKLSSLQPSGVWDQAQILLGLSTVDGLAAIDVEEAASYIASLQNKTTGGFEGDDDLFQAALAVWGLDAAGLLFRLNITLLVDLVLSHYNSSDGGFYEEDGVSYFPINYYLYPQDYRPYNRSNIISTYLAVSILSALDALHLINTTLTLEWILTCLTAYGFRPYPNAHPGCPFIVDEYGLGIPYTYCGLKSLQILGELDRLNDDTRASIASYIWSCQSSWGDFTIIPGGINDMLRYTFYAVDALNLLGSLHQKKHAETVQSIVIHTLNHQYLWFQRHPTPIPDCLTGQLIPFLTPFSEKYGLFGAGQNPLTDTWMALRILKATESLHTLNTLTPRCTCAWLFLAGAAVWCGAASLCAPLIILSGAKKWQILLAAFTYITVAITFLAML